MDDSYALLTEPEKLEIAETALRRVRVAGQGRPRRWWSKTYRDIAEVLRGRLAELPYAGPVWTAPQVEHVPELVAGLAWLARIEEAVRSGETLPAELKLALAETELLTPTTPVSPAAT